MYERTFPVGWQLLAELDESADYEVDMTRIYRNLDGFALATASGCSCWDGEWEVEEFPTLDAIAESLGATGDERRYNPSLVGAVALVSEARAAL